MPNNPFSPADFIPTKFSTAADKADYGNTLLHFLDTGCPQTLFTEKFYTRLSMTFGHIAHYSRHGFYQTWFTCERDRLAFVEKTLRWPCHGDPGFTFSDVECAIQQIMRERNYQARFELKAAETLRTAELRDLTRLEAKYRTPQGSESAATGSVETRRTPVESETVAIQFTLF